MNLYLISQNANCGYEHFDCAVVAAASEQEAKLIHPDGRGKLGDANLYTGDWVDDPRDVTAELIGVAAEGVRAGVICASFNQG